MNDYKIKIKELEDAVKNLKLEYKASLEITTKVLTECKKQGIKRVSIGKKTDLIESAKIWGSGGWGCRGSIFADEYSKDGHPAIWEVAHNTKIGGGCGNSGQYQVRYDANLMEGVWELRDGKWKKID